jgi:copper chaperone CopZ
MATPTQTATKTADRVACPSCGRPGKRVRTVTLRALLRDEFAKRFAATSAACRSASGEGCQPPRGDTGWRFCASMDCDVVYFSEGGDTTFTKSQLKVPVGVKERAGERPLCYCFGHSVASIKEELRTQGRSDALADIRAKMKSPGCRCDVTNPSGSCCLGSVARGIQIAQEEMRRSNGEVPGAGGAAGRPERQSGQREGSTPRATASDPARANPRKGKGVFLATLGAVFTAILGSACCWLPWLLIAFGFSAAEVGHFFEQVRPTFLTATFVLLGAAWCFAYWTAIRRACARLRRAPVPEAAIETCCASGATHTAAACCCPTEVGPKPEEDRPAGAEVGALRVGRRPFAVRQFRPFLLGAATVLVVLLALFPHWGGRLGGNGKGQAGAQLEEARYQRVVLKIRGMSCPSCASNVEQALRRVPGVAAASVHYDNAEAMVFVPKDQPPPRAAILRAVRQAGYTATLRE